MPPTARQAPEARNARAASAATQRRRRERGAAQRGSTGSRTATKATCLRRLLLCFFFLERVAEDRCFRCRGRCPLCVPAGMAGKAATATARAAPLAALKETGRSTGGNPVCWPTSPWLRATPPRPLQAGPGNTQKQRKPTPRPPPRGLPGTTEDNTERAPAPAATPGSASARRAGRPRTGDSGNARKSRQTPAGSRSSAYARRAARPRICGNGGNGLAQTL